MAYQIGIGPSAVGTTIERNFYMGGAKGVVHDAGAGSTVASIASRPNEITEEAITDPARPTTSPRGTPTSAPHRTP